MREPFPPITINFAPVKVVGIPGLSLVAIAVAIAVEFPAGRWLLLSGIAGGVALAAALILVRRPRHDASPSGRNGRLMACDLPLTRQDGWSSPRRSGTAPASRPDRSSTSQLTTWAFASHEWHPGRDW